MEIKTSKINLLLYASIVVALFYAISFSGIIYEPLESVTANLVNRDLSGEGFIEWVEALFWLSAFIIYLVLFIRNFRTHKWEMRSIWLFFLTIWCFVVFGEEISWGQHLFRFESPDYLQAINEQKETNLHNLNLAKIIGLSEDSAFYPYFEVLYKLPQLVFITVCVVVWLIIPALKWAGKFPHSKIIQTVPVYNKGIAVFLGINVIAYLVIDRLFFEVAEIFELALSLTAIISALDLWFQRSDDPVSP